MFSEGSKMVRVAGGVVSFYEKYLVTTLYSERSFGAGVNTITVSNDSTTDTVHLSFNGSEVEGDLTVGESVTINCSTKNSIYICGDAGGGYVRLWGW
jgi:hypothetical protein